MKLDISQELLSQIHTHAQAAYPQEGAGFLLGLFDQESRIVKKIMPLTNAREEADRHNRYLITPQDMLKAENEAASLKMDVIGVFHSHPDHPNQPSQFDREWAMPWFSYIITSVDADQNTASRSWRLSDDRQKFIEESIKIKD